MAIQQFTQIFTLIYYCIIAANGSAITSPPNKNLLSQISLCKNKNKLPIYPNTSNQPPHNKAIKANNHYPKLPHNSTTTYKSIANTPQS